MFEGINTSLKSFYNALKGFVKVIIITLKQVYAKIIFKEVFMPANFQNQSFMHALIHFVHKFSHFKIKYIILFIKKILYIFFNTFTFYKYQR